MNQMIVSVRDKMLRRIGGVNHFVTHNKDYEIQFQFDDSWADVRHKMAVFAYEDGEYGPEIFDGDICAVPELPKEGRVYIGLKAGDELATELLCVQVCKSANDVITDEYDVPDPKIYEQILDIINNLWGGGDTVYPSPVKFLASPSTAKVGDLIRVKEVDENGDVTRTEGFNVGVVLEKKIDAPQTAQVGEVLTVEEVGEDGKPKKWKTAPGVDITTELTQESTDAQVPSAKAAYDAMQNATDKDAVRFVAQELTDTQKQQARENIGTIPKLFWDAKETIAKSIVLDDSGSIGYKDITLPVNVENDFFNCYYMFYIHREGYDNSFNSNECNQLTLVESSDGESLSVTKVKDSCFNVLIAKSIKIFTGIWKVTLKLTKNVHQPTEGMVLDSFYKIPIPRILMAEGTARGTVIKPTDESNIKNLCVRPDGYGYVGTEMSIVRSNEALKNELYNNPRTIMFNYADAPIDIFWMIDYQNYGSSYRGYTGFAMKAGQIGSCVIVSGSGSYLNIQFTPSLVAVPQPTTAQPGQIVRVKSVDESGNISETEAIPHPVLYVTISKTGNTNTSDKTFAEIKSAYNSGCSVFAVVDAFILPLLAVSDNAACFCATTPDGELHRVSVLITESSVSLAYGSFVEGNQGVENAGKILGIDNDGNVVPEDKPVQALAGSAAPTTATAGVVGQEYYVIVDNSVTEMYVCTSALIGSYTWDKVEFGGGGSGSGWNTSQVNLLIMILKNCVYQTNQTANIDALFASLTSTETLNIEKVGSSLIIRALNSTPMKSGSTLSIA